MGIVDKASGKPYYWRVDDKGDKVDTTWDRPNVGSGPKPTRTPRKVSSLGTIESGDTSYDLALSELLANTGSYEADTNKFRMNLGAATAAFDTSTSKYHAQTS